MRPEMAMAKTDQYIKSGFFAVLLYVSLAAGVNGYLKVGFYSSNCPAAESTVFEVVRDAFINNAEVAPGLVRMHFHDCFVRGCDGSVLIDSTAKNTAEKDSPANNPSLHGFDVIDRAKSRLETICPNTVSCADILAFAARDSAKLASPYEFSWDVPAGRRDGIISLSSDIPSNLPPPTFDVSQLTQRFASKGLSQEEMVILSGAHSFGISRCSSFLKRLYNFSNTFQTDPSLDPQYAQLLKQKCPQGSNGDRAHSFGISHCSSFLNRLYNFSNTFQTDPSLDPQYAQLLKQKCPQGSNGDPTVFMDTITPETLDNFYYDGLNMNHGLFTSDATLLTNPNTRNLVHANCGHDNLRRWQISFAAAMVKMGMIIELTGNQGEIRHNCRVINS